MDNHRIQVFDKEGKFIKMWGQYGSNPGEFDQPHGIVVDPFDGGLYVTDAHNDRIQVFI